MTVDAKAQSPETWLKPLMLRGLEGDARAHAQLLSELSRFLRAYFARRLIRGGEDCEDLVQEAVLAIHLKRFTYDRTQPFTPWVYAVARYKLIDHLRRNGRRITVPLEDAGELFAGGNVEEGAVRRDLNTLLGRLPDQQRRLIEDVKITGLTIEEVAERRGVTAVSLRVMLHRSLKWLGQQVRDEN